MDNTEIKHYNQKLADHDASHQRHLEKCNKLKNICENQLRIEELTHENQFLSQERDRIAEAIKSTSTANQYLIDDNNKLELIIEAQRTDITRLFKCIRTKEKLIAIFNKSGGLYGVFEPCDVENTGSASTRNIVTLVSPKFDKFAFVDKLEQTGENELRIKMLQDKNSELDKEICTLLEVLKCQANTDHKLVTGNTYLRNLFLRQDKQVKELTKSLYLIDEILSNLYDLRDLSVGSPANALGNTCARETSAALDKLAHITNSDNCGDAVTEKIAY